MTSGELVTYDLAHWPPAARDTLRIELARAGVDARWASSSFAVAAGHRPVVDSIVARMSAPVPVGPAAPVAPVAPAGPPPGWYPDPAREARWRWWNGREWTGYLGPPAGTQDRGWFPPRGSREQSARGGGLAIAGFVAG